MILMNTLIIPQKLGREMQETVKCSKKLEICKKISIMRRMQVVVRPLKALSERRA
jgi:hypothetical protein